MLTYPCKVFYIPKDSSLGKNAASATAVLSNLKLQHNDVSLSLTDMDSHTTNLRNLSFGVGLSVPLFCRVGVQSEHVWLNCSSVITCHHVAKSSITLFEQSCEMVCLSCSVKHFIDLHVLEYIYIRGWILGVSFAGHKSNWSKCEFDRMTAR